MSGSKLTLRKEGLDDSQDSAFAHRVACEFYLQNEEYESCVETSRRGQKLLEIANQKSGFIFEKFVRHLRIFTVSLTLCAAISTL